jgi:hypothetical protein
MLRRNVGGSQVVVNKAFIFCDRRTEFVRRYEKSPFGHLLRRLGCPFLVQPPERGDADAAPDDIDEHRGNSAMPPGVEHEERRADGIHPLERA